jgi:hypothetical protein
MSVYPLPFVRGEVETVSAVLAGKSLARFGDGELKLMLGQGYIREPPNPKLGRELLDVMQRPNPGCLVGVPTFDTNGPKYQSWLRHALRFCQVLAPNVPYYSAFVSRPDSAPWIRNREYAAMVETIWAGKRVALVCEMDGFIRHTVKKHALSVVHIACPKAGAYAHIKEMQRAVEDVMPDVAILSAGPTATCLANRLAKHGVQAVDLGSIGRFIFQMLWPDEYQPPC